MGMMTMRLENQHWCMAKPRAPDVHSSVYCTIAHIQYQRIWLLRTSRRKIMVKCSNLKAFRALVIYYFSVGACMHTCVYEEHILCTTQTGKRERIGHVLFICKCTGVYKGKWWYNAWKSVSEFRHFLPFQCKYVITIMACLYRLSRCISRCVPCESCTATDRRFIYL